MDWRRRQVADRQIGSEEQRRDRTDEVRRVTAGIYPNYADPGVPAWDRADHGANLDRLRVIKRRYDPGDVVRVGPPA